MKPYREWDPIENETATGTFRSMGRFRACYFFSWDYLQWDSSAQDAKLVTRAIAQLWARRNRENISPWMASPSLTQIRGEAAPFSSACTPSGMARGTLQTWAVD